MQQQIHCRLLGHGKTRLAHRPFPGPIGEHIHMHYSQEAWHLWLEQQTKLLNEDRLNPLESNTKARLLHAMSTFFEYELSR